MSTTVSPSSSQSVTPPADKERLGPLEYIGYALGDTASNFFFQTFSIFLTFYYVDVWHIKPSSLLWLTPVVGLVGAISDPTMGLIADRTRSRWGKFRPYLLFGAIPYGICGYLMFAGPNLSEGGKVAYTFITYMLMMTCYSAINVPYSSMLGVVSSSSRTRAVASSFRFVGAFTGMLLVSLFVRPLVKALGTSADGTVNYVTGFHWTMAIFAVASVFMFWATFATTRERVTPPPQQKTNVRAELGELVNNWPWVMLLVASIFSTTFIALQAGSTVFFFKFVVGDDGKSIFHVGSLDFDRATVFLTVGAIGKVLGTACLGSVVRKVDKKYCAAALSAITGVCLAVFFVLPKEGFGVMLALILVAQFCSGPTSALTWALYGDVADYGELKYGRRSTGLVYSASLFAIKIGTLAGNFLVPMFLQSFGFLRTAPHQSANAMLGITLAFSVVPGFIALLKATALIIYPLNQKRVDEIENALTARRKNVA